MKITQAFLMERYYYKNGHLYHIRSAGRARAGERGGWTDDKGYITIQIDRKRYREHRLIFLYHWGYFPNEIDHINHCRSDNTIENLREATGTQNQANSNPRKGGTSRFKGVSFRKESNRKKRWLAQISIEKRQKEIGYFYTEEEAACAYDQAAIEVFGEFAHTNRAEGLI